MLNKSGVKINGEGSRLKSLGHKPKSLRTSILNNNRAVERFNGSNRLNIVVILSVLVILCIVFILLN